MSLSGSLAIVVAAVAAFLIGAVWYSPLLFGNVFLALRGIDATAAQPAMPVHVVLLEFSRWLIITIVLAGFVGWFGIRGVSHGLLFGILMWLVIYAALAGAVLHEGVPWPLYAIHAGDGLVKLLVISGILSVWR